MSCFKKIATDVSFWYQRGASIYGFASRFIPPEITTSTYCIYSVESHKYLDRNLFYVIVYTVKQIVFLIIFFNTLQKL